MLPVQFRRLVGRKSSLTETRRLIAHAAQKAVSSGRFIISNLFQGEIIKKKVLRSYIVIQLLSGGLFLPAVNIGSCKSQVRLAFSSF